MPKISVIVPVYKVEQYLDRCVESVLAQTFKDFELILVDDGSPDKCGAICDEYAVKDGRIVVIHQENGGLSAARNAGLDWVFNNSNSEWITFVDSDDYIYSGYLEILFDAAVKCDTLISTCNATQEDFFIDQKDCIPCKYITEYAYCDRTILRHRIPAWCKLYHKSLWKDERFPIGKLHEDRFVTHKILFKVQEIATIKAKMYFVTPNPTSITHVKWTPRRLDHTEAADKELEFFQNSPYRKAELRSALSVAYLFAQTIDEIKSSDETLRFKFEKTRTYRKKLRRHLKRYSKALSLTFKNNIGIFMAAFPIRTKFIYYINVVWNKLTKQK